MRKVKVGVIGCGAISSIYLKNCTSFSVLEVAACADLDILRAQAKAAEFGIPKACTVQELLADPDIDLVLNLTIPKAHAEICIQALNAGKHVYVEKPLAVACEDAKKILDLAKHKGLLVGCAPDTVLGAGIQTCRKLIEDGWIGEPIAATAFMMHGGPETFHPDPEFVYQIGGGPMFDMGPYYLTAFIHLLGPIRRVTGSARISFPERVILSQPKYGQMMKVETPTHIAGVLDFQSGVVGTLITSFDVKAEHNMPNMEIYGSQGTIKVPDPNYFGNPVFLCKSGSREWKEIPFTHGYAENSRGLGVADMAYSIINNRPHRANGEVAYHVLEAMHGFHISSKEGNHYTMSSVCSRPDPMPQQMLPNFTLDR